MNHAYNYCKIVEQAYHTHTVMLEGDVEVLLQSYHHLQVVAVRGSESNLVDWWRNFWVFPKTTSIGKVKAPAGYVRAAETIWTWLHTKADWYSVTPTVFCGHSAGGAIARILAAETYASGSRVNSCYTFGAPRIGKKFPVQVYPTFVFERDGDPVPHVPRSWGTPTDGHLITLPDTDKDFADHPIEEYLASVKAWGDIRGT